jgi:hypothetical protein
MEAECCPNCRGSKILPGRVNSHAEVAPTWLVPAVANSIRWNIGIALSPAFHCCLSCGHVWTRLNPDQLRAFVGLNGTKLSKQYLEILDKGPYHDLPDLPAAREAADKVAELDALLIAVKDQEATRRFRELTGTTWDRAIAIVRKWRNYERETKLTLVGWHTKKKAESDEPAIAVHPMLDPWLDS